MEGEAVASLQQQREEEEFLKAVSSGHSSGAETDKNSNSQRKVQDIEETLADAEAVDNKMFVRGGDINRRPKHGCETKKLNMNGNVIGRGRPGCQLVKPGPSQDSVRIPGANSYAREINWSRDSDFEVQQKSKTAAYSPNNQLQTNICTERRSSQNEDRSTGDNSLVCTQRGVSKSKKPEKVVGRGVGRGLPHTKSSPKVGKSEKNLSVIKQSSETGIFDPVQSAGQTVCGRGKIVVSPKDNRLSTGIVKNKSEEILGRGHAISRYYNRRPGVEQSKSREIQEETGALTVQKILDAVKSLHKNELPQMPDVIPRRNPDSIYCEDEQSPSR